MCVIIWKPKGKMLSEEAIRAAWSRNKDGFGYMYYDEEADCIRYGKDIYKDPQLIIDKFKELTDKEACFHFRLRTHGATTDKQCHPFLVTDQEEDGRDILFMHNGIIHRVTEQGDESDTMAFNREVLKPLLKDNPGLIDKPIFDRVVQELVISNKLLFMHGKGEIVVINPKSWDKFDDCLVSNKYSFEPPFSYSSAVNTSGNTSHWTGRRTGETEPEPFLGQNMAAKDVVFIYKADDTTFFEEGVVRKVNLGCIDVSFFVKGKETFQSFNSKSGQAYGAGGYTAVPENFGIDEHSVSTVKEIREREAEELKKKAEQLLLAPPSRIAASMKAMASFKGPESMTTKNPHSGVCMGPTMVTNSSTMTGERWSKMSKEERADWVRSGMEVQKKILERKKDSQSGPPPNLDISYAGIEFHDKEYRYGGAFVEDSYLTYGKDNMTPRDLYNMSPQGRFEWFVTNYEHAYGIFADLIEMLVIQDDEQLEADMEASEENATGTEY